MNNILSNWLYGVRLSFIIIMVYVLMEMASYVISGQFGSLLFVTFRFIMLPIMCVFHIGYTIYVIFAGSMKEYKYYDIVSLMISIGILCNIGNPDMHIFY